MSWQEFWEASTGIGTLALASTTVWLILQNRRHYQEEKQPICALVIRGSTDPTKRGLLLQANSVPQGTRSYVIYCTIKNVGTGPAVRLRLEIRFPDKPGRRIVTELAPLAANGTIGKDIRRVFAPVALSDDFNETDFLQGPDGDWEIWLIYDDVFGNTFHVVHPKNPVRPWAAWGRGNGPS